MKLKKIKQKSPPNQNKANHNKANHQACVLCLHEELEHVKSLLATPWCLTGVHWAFCSLVLQPRRSWKTAGFLLP